MQPLRAVLRHLFGRHYASRAAVLGASALVALIAGTCLFTVDASESVLVTAFGAPVRVIARPGLNVKWPFQSLRRLDNRLLVFTPPPSDFLTLEKTPVVVSSAVLWRIADPRRFFETVFDKAGAESRLGDILYSEMGAAIGRTALSGFVSIDPTAYRAPEILKQVRRAAGLIALRDYGIAIADIELQGFDFPKQNRLRLYARMKSERGRLSMKYRSEGEEEGLKIRTAAEEEKGRILADALVSAQHQRAEGEGEAARIAADAFQTAPDFYQFLRALESAQRLVRSDTALVLPADSDLFGLLLDSHWHEPQPVPSAAGR